LMDKIILKEGKEISPRIKILDAEVDKNILSGINLYGIDSFLINFLQGKGELIYLDIANSPIKKDPEKSFAKNVSVYIEFYDWETGNPLYKNCFAKWVIPENRDMIKTGIDIDPDGISKRLGIAVRKKDDNLTYLLDSSIACFDKNGYFFGTLPSLGFCEKCVMVVFITGNYIQNLPPFFYEITNVKDMPLKIEEMEDGNYWLETARQSHMDWWMSAEF